MTIFTIKLPVRGGKTVTRHVVRGRVGKSVFVITGSTRVEALDKLLAEVTRPF